MSADAPAQVYVLHQHWSYEPSDYLGAFATLKGAQKRGQHLEDAAALYMHREPRPLEWKASVDSGQREPELWEAAGIAGGTFIVSCDSVE